MKKLVEIKNNRQNTLRIMYDLGNLCNYKCWYCFPGSNTGTVPWPDINVVKYNLARLIEFYFEKDIDLIQMNFLGGEPTLWRHLGDLIQYISDNTNYNRKKKNLRITVQTNGSRTIRWWEEYGHYFDHVGISVHHESVDLDHVVKVAEVLTKKNISMLTTVLMDHTAWDKCKSMVNYLTSTKTKFMVLAKPIHINGVTTYTDEQMKYLKKSRKRGPSFWSFISHLDKFSSLPSYKAIFDDGTVEKIRTDHYFILNKLNRFFGWECTLGKNFLFISRDGYISGTCQAKLYGLSENFNINDENFIEIFYPELKPVICHAQECLCAGEAVLSKKKISNKKIIPIYAD